MEVLFLLLREVSIFFYFFSDTDWIQWKRESMGMGYTANQNLRDQPKLTSPSWEPPMETDEKSPFKVIPQSLPK